MMGRSSHPMSELRARRGRFFLGSYFHSTTRKPSSLIELKMTKQYCKDFSDLSHMPSSDDQQTATATPPTPLRTADQRCGIAKPGHASRAGSILSPAWAEPVLASQCNASTTTTGRCITNKAASPTNQAENPASSQGGNIYDHSLSTKYIPITLAAHHPHACRVRERVPAD